MGRVRDCNTVPFDFQTLKGDLLRKGVSATEASKRINRHGNYLFQSGKNGRISKFSLSTLCNVYKLHLENYVSEDADIKQKSQFTKDDEKMIQIICEAIKRAFN